MVSSCSCPCLFVAVGWACLRARNVAPLDEMNSDSCGVFRLFEFEFEFGGCGLEFGFEFKFKFELVLVLVLVLKELVSLDGSFKVEAATRAPGFGTCVWAINLRYFRHFRSLAALLMARGCDWLCNVCCCC